MICGREAGWEWLELLVKVPDVDRSVSQAKGFWLESSIESSLSDFAFDL